LILPVTITGIPAPPRFFPKRIEAVFSGLLFIYRRFAVDTGGKVIPFPVKIRDKKADIKTGIFPENHLRRRRSRNLKSGIRLLRSACVLHDSIDERIHSRIQLSFPGEGNHQKQYGKHQKQRSSAYENHLFLQAIDHVLSSGASSTIYPASRIKRIRTGAPSFSIFFLILEI